MKTVFKTLRYGRFHTDLVKTMLFTLGWASLARHVQLFHCHGCVGSQW